MKLIQKFAATFLLIIAVLFASCKKDGNAPVINPPSNRPPVANAGADQTISLPINTVTLDGSGSTDLDNSITSYTWTKISGPSSFNITNTNAVQTPALNLVHGAYQFELKVTDAGGLFSKDSVHITVNSVTPPTCNPLNRPFVNARLIPVTTGGYGDMVGVIGNKLFFLSNIGSNYGAYTTVNIYDVNANTWLTTPLSVPRYSIGITTSGNKIYFAGGEIIDDVLLIMITSNVDIYDASTNTWTLEHLSSPKARLSAAAIGNKVLFAGGSSATNNFLDEVEIFDLSTNNWSIATLSEARNLSSSVSVNDKVYFAGGFKGDNNGYISNKVDIYNNTTGVWSASVLSEPKAAMAAIVFDNKIYWAGGVNSYSSDQYYASANVEIRDVQTNNSSFGCLFQRNADFSAAKKDGKIMFFTGSGFGASDSFRDKFDIYDVATNTWSIGVLNQSISGQIISINNTIYVNGWEYSTGLNHKIWKLEF